MDEAEFDKFADEYRAMHSRSIFASGEGPDYFAEYKIRDLAELLRTRGIGTDDLAILDFGAGIGNSVPFIRKYFQRIQLTCLDVSEASLAFGAARFPGLARFAKFDGSSIPYESNSQDVVLAACVFHHIPHEEHVGLFREIFRVLKPAGCAFIFEHNPYNPLTVRAVKDCPFDQNARLIAATTMRERLEKAGFGPVCIRYRVFFPRMLRAFRPLERWMTWLPLGAQYFAAATK
jgi:SAM-dependent methyltransferase